MPPEVCFLCEASKGAEQDMYRCYTDVSDSASYWQTLCQTNPWAIAPQLCFLLGFHISMVVPDLLHVWNLGVQQMMLGSALRVILSEQVVFTSGDLESRLAEASASLRSFVKRMKLPLRWKKISKTRLRWSSKNYPQLTGSGYDVYVISRWLLDVLQAHLAIYPEIGTLLWTSGRAMSLLYDGGWFLTSGEKDTLRFLGDVFCRLYITMASDALQRGVLLWRVTPKIHLLKHVLRADRHANVSKYSTWVDEDFLKKLVVFGKSQTKPRPKEGAWRDGSLRSHTIWKGLIAKT